MIRILCFLLGFGVGLLSAYLFTGSAGIWSYASYSCSQNFSLTSESDYSAVARSNVYKLFPEHKMISRNTGFTRELKSDDTLTFGTMRVEVDVLEYYSRMEEEVRVSGYNHTWTYVVDVDGCGSVNTVLKSQI